VTAAQISLTCLVVALLCAAAPVLLAKL